jgi:hypothetical protein
MRRGKRDVPDRRRDELQREATRLEEWMFLWEFEEEPERKASFELSFKANFGEKLHSDFWKLPIPALVRYLREFPGHGVILQCKRKDGGTTRRACFACKREWYWRRNRKDEETCPLKEFPPDYEVRRSATGGRRRGLDFGPKRPRSRQTGMCRLPDEHVDSRVRSPLQAASEKERGVPQFSSKLITRLKAGAGSGPVSYAKATRLLEEDE